MVLNEQRTKELRLNIYVCIYFQRFFPFSSQCHSLWRNIRSAEEQKKKKRLCVCVCMCTRVSVHVYCFVAVAVCFVFFSTNKLIKTCGGCNVRGASRPRILFLSFSF